jgi:hypothetical protein
MNVRFFFPIALQFWHKDTLFLSSFQIFTWFSSLCAYNKRENNNAAMVNSLFPALIFFCTGKHRFLHEKTEFSARENGVFPCGK